jgi:hypothetical protein
MNPIHQNAIGGTELSPKQVHSIHQNASGTLEFSPQIALTEDELKAIERIKLILDKLHFENED